MLESIIVFISNLILPYLVLSLFVMLLVELIATILQLRGFTLKQFIQRMLDDPHGKGIAGDLYRHHLIESLSDKKHLPSYIPSELFAIALVDTIRKYAGDNSLSDGIQRLPNKDLRRGMLAILEHPSFGHGQELTAIEFWYGVVMDVASGAYRFRALLMVIGVAIIMVVSVNFDAIRISNHVAQRNLIEKILESRIQSAMKADPTKAQTISPSSATLADLSSLQALAFPIGWAGERELYTREDKQPDSLFNWLIMKVVGLLTSILAITVGAPFLFDLLNKFITIRATAKPVESLPPESRDRFPPKIDDSGNNR